MCQSANILTQLFLLAFPANTNFLYIIVYLSTLAILLIALIATAKRLKNNSNVLQKKLEAEIKNKITLQNENDEIKSQLKLYNNKNTDLENLVQKTQNHLTLANEKLKLQEEHIKKLQHQNKNDIQNKISKLKKAKDEAETSEKMKMAFLANMSHEIRTPMNAIIGFASLLNDDDLKLDEKNDFIRQIQTNGESLMILINDILDLSKIEARQLIITKEKFDVYTFMKDIYMNWMISDLYKLSNIELIFKNIDETIPIPFYSDIYRLRQILNNLIENAFKFTEQGTIIIGYEKGETDIRFSVKDTGVGIPEENIDLIFNRFNTRTDIHKSLYKGAGLGLTISRKIAEILDGTLKLNSKVGSGSEFILTLPLDSDEQLEMSDDKLKVFNLVKNHQNEYIDLNLIGRSFLIAEDEVNNYKYLEGVLKKHNALIAWARNGEEAVEMVNKIQPDIIFMDIKMPKLNGVEATQKIKQMNPNQLIIAQTAYANQDEILLYKQSGFDDFIAKPIKRNDFLNLIKKHLSL